MTNEIMKIYKITPKMKKHISFLSNFVDFCSKIYLINIADKFTAHQYLIDRVETIKKVQVINNAYTKKILGEKFVSSIQYLQDEKLKELNIDGIFIEIGRIPNNDLVKNLVELDDHEHIVVDCQTKTSIPGLFAAGDVTNVHEYQYVISAGQGCTALIKAAKYLANSEE